MYDCAFLESDRGYLRKVIKKDQNVSKLTIS